MIDAHILYVFLATTIGLLVGSFANVCVHRIPRQESIVFPASQCPSCKHKIAWYDNLPIISWVLLRGQCRHCNSKISWRYPLLEITMALIWMCIAWAYPHTEYNPIFIAQAIILMSFLWILTLIDLETFLLPNALTFPGIGLGLFFSWQLGYFTEALIGSIVGYLFFWMVARMFFLATGKEGMGQGDFKLLAMLGAFMGWQALPFIIMLSSVTGAIIGSIALVMAKKGLRAEIPYGPYLAGAGAIWFFWGEPILLWYQRFLGIA